MQSSLAPGNGVAILGVTQFLGVAIGNTKYRRCCSKKGEGMRYVLHAGVIQPSVVPEHVERCAVGSHPAGAGLGFRV